MQAVQPDDDSMQEWAPRIELECAHEVISDAAEVALQVSEQIDPGREQQYGAHRPLEGDQAQDAATSGCVSCARHDRERSQETARGLLHGSRRVLLAARATPASILVGC